METTLLALEPPQHPTMSKHQWQQWHEEKSLRPQSTPQHSEGRHLPWAVGFRGNGERVREFGGWRSLFFFEQLRDKHTMHYYTESKLLHLGKFIRIFTVSDVMLPGTDRNQSPKMPSTDNWQLNLRKWLTVCTSQTMTSHPTLFTNHFSQSTDRCLPNMWPVINYWFISVSKEDPCACICYDTGDCTCWCCLTFHNTANMMWLTQTETSCEVVTH